MTCPAEPSWPTTEEISTIRPARARTMGRAARRTTWNVPVRLVSMTLSQSSSLIRMSRVSRVTPALATSTSTGPSCDSTAAKAASTCSTSVMSQRTPRIPGGTSPLRNVAATR